MSMSKAVTVYRTDKDPEYVKHLAVWQACKDADIEWLPRETADYFDGKSPRTCWDSVVPSESLVQKMPIHEFVADTTEGFEIYVSQIPQGAERIVFTISY